MKTKNFTAAVCSQAHTTCELLIFSKYKREKFLLTRIATDLLENTIRSLSALCTSN